MTRIPIPSPAPNVRPSMLKVTFAPTSDRPTSTVPGNVTTTA
jgi:hypothetical protein